MKNRSIALVATLLAVAVISPAQTLDPSKWLDIGRKDKVADTDVVSGLKEALQVGSGNAVNLTGKVNGYFGNEAIKILMPSQLRTVEKGLRAIGQGQKVDDFVLAMNRAAEKAAPAAKDIFWGAIKGMSFDDARKILGGGDTAATDYLRTTTGDSLTSSFRPVVSDSMKDVGVVQKYKQLQGSYQSIPFASSLPSVDIEQYVVSKAMDGLFLVLGNEERKIRADPGARVTDLLKKVFNR